MSTHHSDTPRQKAGSAVFALTALIPGMVLGGFFGDLVDLLPLFGWVGGATVGGAIAGAIFDEHAPAKTSVCGALAGCGTVLAVPFYAHLRASLSDTFLTAEFVIPMVVGSLPGIGLYRFWAARARPVATVAG